MSEAKVDIIGIRQPRHLMVLAQYTLQLQQVMQPLLETEAKRDGIASLGKMGERGVEIDDAFISINARMIFADEVRKKVTALIASPDGVHEVRVTTHDHRRQVRVLDDVGGKGVDDPEIIKKLATRLRVARNVIAQAFPADVKLISHVQNGTITPYDMAIE